MVNLIGMAASERLLPRRASPTLELRRVLDEATARDCAVMPTLKACCQKLFERICNLHLWHEDSFGYVDKNIMPSTP